MNKIIFIYAIIFSINGFAKTIEFDCQSDSNAPYSDFVSSFGSLELDENSNVAEGSIFIEIPYLQKQFDVLVSGTYSSYQTPMPVMSYDINLYHTFADKNLYSKIEILPGSASSLFHDMRFIYDFKTYNCSSDNFY